MRGRERYNRQCEWVRHRIDHAVNVIAVVVAFLVTQR